MVPLAEYPRRPAASRRSPARRRGFTPKIQDYIFGSYIDEVLCMVKANGDRFFFSTNDLYSAYALTDSNGDPVERYIYSPYGACIVLAADGVTVRAESLYGNPWTFTGRRLDGETGLMYFRNRIYSVDLGRFIGRDPWRERHGIPTTGDGYRDGPNLYRAYFVPSSLDPKGLWGDGTRGRTPAGQTSGNQGHSDFPGSRDLGGPFDYTGEDWGWTRPENPFSTWRHFRSLDESEKDLSKDVVDCARDRYGRHAHQMQDFFSHYGQDMRSRGWAPIVGIALGPVPAIAGLLTWGHVADSAVNDYGPGGGPRPDNADDYRDAFDAASARSQEWYDLWKSCCCLTHGGGGVDWGPVYWAKKPFRDEKKCANVPSANTWGENAPQGKRAK